MSTTDDHDVGRSADQRERAAADSGSGGNSPGAPPAGEDSPPPPVPFGPIDFSDPQWWERIPLRGLPEDIDPQNEGRVLAALVLAKAQRILWASRSLLVVSDADARDPGHEIGPDRTEATDAQHAHGPSLPPSLDGMTMSGLADWVAFRFQHSLVDSSSRAKSHNSRLLWLSVATASSGLLASGLAVVGGDGAAGVSGEGSVSSFALAAAVFGVLVGVLTGVTQILKPAQRSVASYQLLYSLRREGWDFVSGRGRYRGRSGPQALDLFIDEVNRIERAAEAIDETAEASRQSQPAT